MTRKISNFGRNVQFQPAEVYHPSSPSEVLEILDRHRGQPIRAVGSLHSWSNATESKGILLQMDRMVTLQLEDRDGEVRVNAGAGCKIKHLIAFLEARGLTLPSLGLIDEQTVSGATATGTHGSGKHCLSQYIEAVEIAHYDAETGRARVTSLGSGQELAAARCSLGLLGIIVSVSLRCRPSYHIEEHAQIYDSLEPLLAAEASYPQQQFYLMPWSWKWLAHHRVETSASRSRMARLYRWYCLGAIDVGLHTVLFALVKILRSPAVIRFFYRNIVPLTLIQNWKVVDQSQKMLTMQHELFRHIEIEIFIQRPKLEEIVRYVTDVICQFGGREMLHADETRRRLDAVGRVDDLESGHGTYVHHYPICIRRVVCDDTLISMTCPGPDGVEDWYAISLISYHWPSERKGFFGFADFIGTTAATIFEARCHWGKYNPLDRAINEQLYPSLRDFASIRDRFDPQGAFRNDWLKKVVP